MGKKGNLLTESQVRQFMKLANLQPLTPGFVHGLREATAAEDEAEARAGGPEAIAALNAKRAARNKQIARARAAQQLADEGNPSASEDEIDDRVDRNKSDRAAKREREAAQAAKSPEQRSMEAAAAEGGTAFNQAVFGKEDAAALEASPEKRIVKYTGAEEESVAAQTPGEKLQNLQKFKKGPLQGKFKDPLKAAILKKKAEKQKPATEPAEEPAEGLQERARRLRRESHGRGRGEGAAGYGKPDDNGRAGARLREQLPPDEEGLEPLDELPPDEEGLEPLDELPPEGEEGLEGLEGGGREVSVDDFLAALEVALEDVLGDEVEVEQDEEEEELDLGPEEEPLPPEGELPLGDDELPLQEMINTITKRVAKRIVREALQKKK